MIEVYLLLLHSVKKIIMENPIHHSKLLSLYQHLHSTKEFADVTLVSEDYVTFEAHKSILAHSSAVLRKLMCLSQEQKPILYLKGLSSYEIENMLRFLYLGENWLDVSRFHHLGIFEDDVATIEPLPNANYKSQSQNIKHENVHKLDFLFQPNEEPSEQSKIIDNKTFDYLQEEKDTIYNNDDSSDNLNAQESSFQIQSDNLIEGDGNVKQNFDENVSGIFDNQIEGEGNREQEFDETAYVKIKELSPKNTNKRKKEEPAECDICAIKFTAKRSLQRHNKLIHELVTIKCPQCDKDCRGRDGLNSHIRTWHEEKKTYYCDKCEYKATTKFSVKQHRLKVHIYSCTFCQITYTKEEELKVHIKEEHVNKFC